jgi:hypothetical protein
MCREADTDAAAQFILRRIDFANSRSPSMYSWTTCLRSCETAFRTSRRFAVPTVRAIRIVGSVRFAMVNLKLATSYTGAVIANRSTQVCA